MFADVGLNVKLTMMEVAEWVQVYSKPFAEDRGPRMVMAMHDNNRGDPVFSMFFKYACEGVQSGICDADLDKMLADATAATGDARGPAWSPVFAKVHNDIVAACPSVWTLRPPSPPTANCNCRKSSSSELG
jgi:peptide/nickel transport system substrate-binding protein